MEKAVSAADANRNFSQLLREVRKGGSYVVTSHGKPVARIVPANGQQVMATSARRALFDRLRSQRVSDIGHWTREELYEDVR